MRFTDHVRRARGGASPFPPTGWFKWKNPTTLMPRCHAPGEGVVPPLSPRVHSGPFRDDSSRFPFTDLQLHGQVFDDQQGAVE